MLEYLIKSTFTVAILWGFYRVVLRNEKIPQFNRFYLLISILFSLLLPLVKIKTNLNLVISPSIPELSNSFGHTINGGEYIEDTLPIFTIQYIILVLYILISAALFTRFSVNLFKIIRTIRSNKQVPDANHTIVLMNYNTLPFSFFNYIFMSQSDFENDIIDKELLIHEKSHCIQYHTIDILLIELTKILMWFNPIIWIYKREIQLNHEVLADSMVIEQSNINDYQKIILKYMFYSSSLKLTSSFNNSLIKNRLIMMDKIRSCGSNYKIAVIPIVAVLLAYSISCSNEQLDTGMLDQQESKIESGNINQLNGEQWWNPILDKHHIERRASNNFGNIFEMGTTNSITNGVVILENAVFIIKEDDDDEKYIIIKCELGYHNLNKKIIEVEDGTLNTYSSKSKNTDPIRTFSFKSMKWQFKEDNMIISIN